MPNSKTIDQVFWNSLLNSNPDSIQNLLLLLDPTFTAFSPVLSLSLPLQKALPFHYFTPTPIVLTAPPTPHNVVDHHRSTLSLPFLSLFSLFITRPNPLLTTTVTQTLKSQSYCELHYQQSKPKFFLDQLTSTKTHSPLPNLIATQSNLASISSERARAVTVLAPIATHISPTISLLQPLTQPTSTSTMATLNEHML